MAPKKDVLTPEVRTAHVLLLTVVKVSDAHEALSTARRSYAFGGLATAARGRGVAPERDWLTPGVNKFCKHSRAAEGQEVAPDEDWLTPAGRAAQALLLCMLRGSNAYEAVSSAQMSAALRGQATAAPALLSLLG